METTNINRKTPNTILNRCDEVIAHDQQSYNNKMQYININTYENEEKNKRNKCFGKIQRQWHKEKKNMNSN